MAKIKVDLKYFNQCWNISITTPDKIGKVVAEWNRFTQYGKIVLQRRQCEHLTVYNYFLIAADDGKAWSSRAAIVNKFMNTELVDVAINNCSYAIRKDDLAKLLPPGARMELVKSLNSKDEMQWQPVFSSVKSLLPITNYVTV